MKLLPKAKPVRIRVKLGENEYTSLSDLRDNFSVEELYPLFKDGRLSRWLRQIGETGIADKVEEMSSKCSEHPQLSDYIRLMSVFFDKIGFYDSKKPFEDYLSTVPTDVLKLIYSFTKSKKGAWQMLINKAKTTNNLKRYFEDEDLRSIFTHTEWGMRFANTLNGNYKEVFNYLYNQGLSYEDVFTSFFEKARNSGMSWEIIFSNQIEFEVAVRLYGIPTIRELNIDWAEIFAGTIHDWEKDSPRVIKSLKDNEIVLRKIYELNFIEFPEDENINTLHNLIKEAKETSQENKNKWKCLKTGKDAAWLRYLCLHFSDTWQGESFIDRYGYNRNITTKDGKQIYRFYESIVNAYNDSNISLIKQSWDLLLEESIIFEAVCMFMKSQNRKRREEVIKLLSDNADVFAINNNLAHRIGERLRKIANSPSNKNEKEVFRAIIKIFAEAIYWRLKET